MLFVLFAAAGCGRISFDLSGATPAPDAAAGCTGDLLVDTSEDDPAAALACQGAGCSLRAAIGIANTQPGTTICLAEGLSISVANALVVSKDVTITGTPTSICSTGTDRVFDVLSGGALRLRNLRVCHGRLSDDSGAGVAVEDGGTLDADQVVFDDHVIDAVTGPQEGAAVHGAGTSRITLQHCRFTNNRAVSTGGMQSRGGAFGIRATAGARVIIQDCAFEDNTSATVGGAMFFIMDGSALTLERVLFARNSSVEGGAIDINCSSTNTFEITNSTFVDNVTRAPSTLEAAIFVCGTETVRLAFSTFSGNQGAAVRLDSVNGRAEWRGNALHVGAYDMCVGAGTSTSLDHNVADHSDAICPLTGVSDRLVDPLLAPLADNGGFTQTLALMPGSPAIDAAGISCPATDQRALPRPVGAACDAGAFEVQ